MASRQPVHSVLFDNSQDTNQYYGQQPSSQTGGDGLQFYASTYGDQYSANTNANYYSSAPTGDMRSPTYDYTSGTSGSFWSAFGTGGFADEPPLLEELGLNFGHIKTKV